MEDENQVKAMQEKLNQFQKNDVWKHVELPKYKKAIRAKRVLRNKLEENGKVVRKKTRLVVLSLDSPLSQLEDLCLPMILMITKV